MSIQHGNTHQRRFCEIFEITVHKIIRWSSRISTCLEGYGVLPFHIRGLQHVKIEQCIFSHFVYQCPSPRIFYPSLANSATLLRKDYKTPHQDLPLSHPISFMSVNESSYAISICLHVESLPNKRLDVLSIFCVITYQIVSHTVPSFSGFRSTLP